MHTQQQYASQPSPAALVILSLKLGACVFFRSNAAVTAVLHPLLPLSFHLLQHLPYAVLKMANRHILAFSLSCGCFQLQIVQVSY